MNKRTASNGNARGTELVGPRSALVRKLTEAYWGEIETVRDYVASSTNRDGMRAERISSSLREAIACHLDHAQRLAMRISRLHGPIPGPDDLSERLLSLRAPADPLDSMAVLTGLIEAETAAVERYRRITAVAADALDWVTEGLVAQLIRESETCHQLLQSDLTNLQKSSAIISGEESALFADIASGQPLEVRHLECVSAHS